jgi:hypothetical protein
MTIENKFVIVKSPDNMKYGFHELNEEFNSTLKNNFKSLERLDDPAQEVGWDYIKVTVSDLPNGIISQYVMKLVRWGGVPPLEYSQKHKTCEAIFLADDTAVLYRDMALTKYTELDTADENGNDIIELTFMCHIYEGEHIVNLAKTLPR